MNNPNGGLTLASTAEKRSHSKTIDCSKNEFSKNEKFWNKMKVEIICRLLTFPLELGKLY